jgi:glucuronate isomerase
MPTPFIHDDFMLESEAARRLYHDYAKGQPILDYHCHLSPEWVASDHQFRSITELWLDGDHYKWRALRADGVSEQLCTGNASDWEKFEAWAATVPRTLRNPLYDWTHLELGFPFGIKHLLLDTKSARWVFDACNERLTEPEFRAAGLLRQFNVEAVCTTDDPSDDLRHHQSHAGNPKGSKLYPTWRPDGALGVDDPDAYNSWLDRLAEVSAQSIQSYDDLLAALELRHAFFHEQGCRLSDHGLEQVYADEVSLERVRNSFSRVRSGATLSLEAASELKSALLYEFGVMDHAKGWVQQFHIGPLRNNNSRMFGRLGPNTGYDCIGDASLAAPLNRFLDRLDESEQLAKTIVYNSNPRDNEMLATLIGNFQQGPGAGKIQFGAAWWFLDQRSGMTSQLDALSNMGLLSRFVGMLTDSRSFLSYSRHEYFRRLLCNLLGSEVERGLLPRDFSLVGDLVTAVCYRNAKEYFPWA